MRGSSSSRQLILLGAILAGCAGGGTRGDGGTGRCETDFDCDDGHACTIDACGVGNACVHDPISERCEAGQTCEVGRGCVSSASCASDPDCDDGVACTIDRCGVGGICNHSAVNERCSAGQVCDVDEGCIEPPGCSSSAECDDSIACTNDTCGVDRTCANTPLDERCDMAAGERCNAVRGCFVPMPCTTAAECDDMNFCNGPEACVPEFGCSPSEEPRVCDDSDDCTIDSCDAGLDMCVFTCDSSRTECMCPTAPPTCDGSFLVTGPTTSYSCRSLLGSVVINVNFGSVTMMNDGGILNVRLAAQHFSSALTDVTDPVCPNFEASAVVSGGCEETYTISGTFTDVDNFSGMFRIGLRDVDGSCGLTDCIAQNVAITGRRM